MRRLVGLMALVFLIGCGGAAPTPTVDVRPTQTRAAEVAQLAALQTQVTAPTTVPPLPTLTATVAVTLTASPTAANTPMPIPTVRPTTSPTVRNTVVPTPTPTQPLGKIGERIVSRGLAVTIVEMRDPLPRAQYSAPKAGFRWIACDVIVENVGTGPSDYNPYFARVKTADSREYPSGINDPDLKPTLQYGTQQPGDSSRGWIGFEVQEDAQLATLSYSIGGTNPRITVDLR